MLALPLFAPASWLADAVASASGQRLLLADAQGTVWRGSALPVLTGGPGSSDASALADRLHWQLGIDFGWQPALRMSATQSCCLNGSVILRVRPGIGRIGVTLSANDERVGQWPSAWLAGLGTPWNTLQLGGTWRLESRDLTLTSAAGRIQVTGSAAVGLERMSSQLSPLPVLGSYRLTLAGGGTGPPQIVLSTIDGALQLNGSGDWGPQGIRFRGEASAGANDEALLSNLLNIIGRRDNARSVISIG